MQTYESPSISVARPGDTRVGSDPLRTIVWVRGEHDIATRVNLSVTIARAAGRDDADIVVDLSGVTFMDASTIGALVVARDRLRSRSRSLSLRDPSPRAQRVLDLCGLTQMVDDQSAQSYPTSARAIALSTWVDVPVLGRVPDSTEPLDVRECPIQEPARVTAPPPAPRAVSVQRRRAPT